jgi:putative endopeptidase
MTQKWNISFFHSKMIDADFEDSSIRALVIDSMSLGMSDRDFYDESHPRHQQIKAAYKEYVNGLISETEVKLATSNIFDLIYNFEKEIAQSMLKKEELRNPKNIYNVRSVEQISSEYNFIN